jgi:hypothetical protein
LSTWQARRRHRLLARNSRAEELGCRPSREEGRRGRRRISVLHGHLHELEKVQMRQLPRKPKHSPASRSARGACPIRADYTRWCSAFLLMTPGGLTKLSSAGGPPRFRRLRESTRSHETARGRPCGERQGSPEPCDFSRCEKSALRSPRSHRSQPATSNTPRDAPLVDRNR